jgi:hypothetical protein
LTRLWTTSLICFLIAIAAFEARADGDLFGSSGLDPSFCKQPNNRQTVVYIDDMMMMDGKQDWATKLAGKLRATLAPGERLIVVRLSPGSGQSSEIWNGCWPEFSTSERERIEKERYLFSKSPLESLSEQKKFFMRDLDRALAAIYVASKRVPANVRVDPQHPPQKNIIRALAFDEGRFAQSQITIRAIVYSDLAESSDLGSVFKQGDIDENYGKKLGTYLRRSVFYAYGMAEDVTNSASVLEQTKKFWNNALRSMNASVGGLGTDLNMPNAVPVFARSFVLDLKRDTQDLDGRLSVLTDADGNLVDSWLQIIRLSISGLSGTFKCQGTTEDQTCRLSAKTTSGIVTQSAEEDVLLSGSERSGLTGQIGVKGALMYALQANKAEN